MSDLNLQHPEITWAERTGFPSWCQEVLGDFPEEEESRMSDRAEIVLDAIPYGKDRAVTREYLAAKTGLPDRQVRKAIEEIRRNHIVLNDQDGKGYYRSYDLDDIERFYRQERARALAVLYRMKPMRILLRGGGRI
jgi:biotin operon repressor